ncbi:EAL domain-containing protein [Aeromonas jandaei]|uniref:EAL domain-containing protein n=1 Tax=Aeromonas jandaei TaxID=650 RepID=UPI003BA26092
MPFHRLKTSKLRARLFAALLAGGALLVLGELTVAWQTMSEVNKDARQRLQYALTLFDRTMDHARQAASNVQDEVGKPCPDVAQRLREQAATIPDVRSVTLTRGSRLYCSSLYGDYNGAFNVNNYVAGRLQLLKGNAVTPDHPLIIFRHAAEQGSVLIGVDGYYLRNILDISSKNSPMALIVGTRAMFGTGLVADAPPATDPGYLAFSSTRYPYQVATRVMRADYLNHAWRHSWGSIMLYPLLGLLVGVGTFRLMGRSHSPEEELKRALFAEEFIPYLQPVVTGEDAHWSGCEVLMRWQHPKQGMISPDRFIPLAEDSGLIVPMTSLMMAQVRDYFAPFALELPKGFHFGFNISASHCKDLSLVADCRAFIEAFRDNPIKLVLELTERELIVADEMTDRLFAELQQLGVFIAIDDFGTGHSSLTYLQQFKVDFLKIDQSFVGMIGSDALSSHIVENVIDLATRLGLQLVAEGVENQVQADYLRARHVDFLQGYLYGRPLPIEQFSQQLFASESP